MLTFFCSQNTISHRRFSRREVQAQIPISGLPKMPAPSYSNIAYSLLASGLRKVTHFSVLQLVRNCLPRRIWIHSLSRVCCRLDASKLDAAFQTKAISLQCQPSVSASLNQQMVRPLCTFVFAPDMGNFLQPLMRLAYDA